MVPFVRLPIKEYSLSKDPRPRVDIEYLKDYQSSESSESSQGEEEEYTFSSDSSSEDEENSNASGEGEDEDEDEDEDDESGQSQSVSEFGEDEQNEMGAQEQESNSYYTIDELETLTDVDDDYASDEEETNTTVKVKKPRKPSLASRFKAYIRRGKRYQRFQAWRKKNAEKRRHQMLRYWEKQVELTDRRIRAEIERECAEDYEALIKHARKLKKIRKAHLYREQRVVNRDMRFERELRRRKKEHQRIQFNVWNMEGWARQDFEIAEAEAVAKAEKIKAEEERRKREIGLSMKNDEAFQDENMLEDDFRETQMVLKKGRQVGAHYGVNAHKHRNVPEIPSEVTRNLTISLKKGIEFAWKPKHMRTKEELAPFNVDLKLYRDVEHLRAFQIGQRGALALAAEFVRGSCSNIITLNLGRCQVHSRGLGKILHGLRIGRVVNLEVLNLRGNSICANGLHFIQHALEKNSLQNLKVLDLRENELCDEGAHLIAHMMIANVFCSIRTLYLQRNMINNVGVEKIVHVYKAVKDVKCPQLRKLALEENLTTLDMKRKLRSILPTGISI